MKSIKLEFSLRDKTQDANALRADGKVPGVIYGPELKNTVVYIQHQDLRKAYNSPNDNLQVEFELDGRTHIGLFRDVKVDYLMDKITHFDVFVPKESASMLFHMPIQFTGQSLAVKNLGAVLEQYMETIPVECTLANLPEVLEVDISPLVELGSIIKVKDLSIPENVQFKTADSHSVVASKAPKRVVTVVETPVGGVAEGDADESADSTASSEETASE